MITLKSFDCYQCGLCFPMLEMEEDYNYSTDETIEEKVCRLCWWNDWLTDETDNERIIRGQKEVIQILNERIKYLYTLENK